MTLVRTAVLAAGLTLGAMPAIASADALVVPATDATNVASGGGWLAWAQRVPGGTGWQLGLRSPAGEVTTPNVRFDTAPDPSIGTEGAGSGGERRLLVVYSRDGDIMSYGIADGREARVSGASTRAYTESAPSLNLGRLTFVRKGGKTNGLFYLSGGTARRISGATPKETVQNGSRVAYPSGNDVVVRRLSGEGAVSKLRSPSRPLSLVMTRYQVSWLVSRGTVYRTPRFGGSGDVQDPDSARAGSRRLPSGTNGIALGDTDVRWFSGGAGINRVSPELFSTPQ